MRAADWLPFLVLSVLIMLLAGLMGLWLYMPAPPSLG